MNRTNLRPISFIIFSLFMVLTVLLAYATYRSFRTYDQGRFNALILEIENNIAFRMQTYVNALEQTRNMFKVDHDLNRETFREYFEGLNFRSQYPGIQGMGYSIKVMPDKIRQFEQKTRVDPETPNYRIWPKGDREVFFPILYLEPMDVLNLRAIGYDMFSEPLRRKAMELARDTGKPVATGKIVLVQEAEPSKPQPGFNIYVPLYNKTGEHLGFIYSPFRAGDLFRGIFKTLPMPVDFEVFVGEVATLDNMIFDSDGVPSLEQQLPSMFQKEVKLKVASKTWTVRFHSLPEFEAASPYWVSWLVLISGSVISILVFWLFQNHAKQVLVDQQRVHQLESINQIAKVISAQLNMDKLVKAVTDAGLNLTHAQAGAFFQASSEDGVIRIYTTSSGDVSETIEIERPTNVPLFDLTFLEKTTVRSEDVSLHPLYARRSPIYPLFGNLQKIRSYLAVPVVLRTGEVMGALVYVHEQSGLFTQKEQALIESMASQAAVGMDNARLFLEAQEAIRVRDEFFSIASHELKTPLTSLKLQVQSMLRYLAKKDAGQFSEEKVTRLADLADKQIGRLTALVDDLLDISRISSGRLTLNKEEVDVSHLIQETVERMKPNLQEHNTHMDVQGPSDLVGNFDRLRLEQVLVNLLSNAIKYGSERPVQLRYYEKDGSLHLHVIDQGIGITEEDRKRIFDRFERVLSSARVGGLGLGLYITQQIVQAHGGSISVESEPGKGSDFQVVLPLS